MEKISYIHFLAAGPVKIYKGPENSDPLAKWASGGNNTSRWTPPDGNRYSV